MSVLVVGSIAFDSIATPFGQVDKAQGGSATYFSLAAAQFTDVRLVGVVGEDFEDRHMGVFGGRRIDTSGLVRAPGKTFHWKGAYEYDMNEAHTLATELNVLEGFSAAVPEAFRDSPYVFLANIEPRLQLHVLDQVKAPRFVAADSMNYWMQSRLGDLKLLLKRVDCLVINEGEARMLGGTTNIRKAGRLILDMGPRILVVKRGEYGVIMMNGEGRVFAAPGLPLEEVVDPTGAGDSFAGGMMGYLAHGGDLSDVGFRRALVAGSVMASFTVEGFGLSRLETVTAADLSRRFGEFSTLTHFERL